MANLLAPDAKITFRNIENYAPSIYKSADTLDAREGHRYIKNTSHALGSLPPNIQIAF
jgi:hypothetical protein